MKSKKVKLIEADSTMVITKVWGMGIWKDVDQRVQTFSFMINSSGNKKENKILKIKHPELFS